MDSGAHPTIGGHLSRRSFLLKALAVSGLVLVETGASTAESPRFMDPPGTVEAGLLARSYRPGSTAQLVVESTARRLSLQVMQAGREPKKARAGMGGIPVTAPKTVPWHGGRGILHLDVERWPTGLHYVQLEDSLGQTGFAPFVVRPHELGQARTLVVHPTNTWGAYNFREGATWYANADVHHVDLTRPYLGGVPPHYRNYDMGFIRWLAHSGHEADIVSDDDLEAMPHGDELSRLYDLVVFAGHEEYVTEHVFDTVERFQALGGNLMFLSANNFFYKIEKEGDVMHGRWRWRDLGRPEARMIGSQYLNWYQDAYRNRPLQVTGAERAPWLFEGTGFSNGSTFGTYGIEIDAIADSSPEGVQVLAEIPNIFGEGQTAQMTHYQAANGAEVFDAGVLNFAGTAENPGVNRMIENLWQRLGPRA
ncbi:MAG TPA: N,N-dimethylformamidase beta subunit family domain-containing protein [Gaiellaceae bacterium]|jgi:hypothetical protein